ncbi:MAG: sigma 54-interacting transcriptional regulator [Peptococcaceae bacterium]
MDFLKKRIVFISYPRLTKVISQLVPTYFKDVIVYEANINEVLEISRKLIYENAIDVIISGGGNGQHLKEHIKEIPVIVFKITVADLLQGIKNLSLQAGKIGILGYRDVIPDLLCYKDYISCNFMQDWYTSTEQMQKMLQKMIMNGCDGFIGTGVVCDYATDYGFPAYMVYSRENVEETFKEAFKYQWALNFNREREERTNMVLNHSKRAFLFINSDRKIQTVNSSAEQILGIPKNQLVGSVLDEIVDVAGFDSVLNGTTEVSESMVKLTGKELVVTWKPIKIDNHLTEVIGIFDDNLDLQKAKKDLLGSGFTASYHFENIIGQSKPIRDAVELARDYAATGLTVLIRGETGTGKELFAQSIHNQSSRSSRPFVSVNCSALPDSLLESELFGYETGTFTGGRKGGKLGLIEQANFGTLFLDEIGDMSLHGQVLLLRVLQERKLRRLGGTKNIPVDVRVIAATNQPLEIFVNKGLFRSDLYYRLNVLNLNLPPLRLRREDIPELTGYFIKEYGLNMNGKILDILNRMLMQADHPWLGNIRELENFVLRINSFVRKKPKNVNRLIEELLQSGISSLENTRYDQGNLSMNPERQNEKTKILEVLEQMRWNKTMTAKALGVSRTTLWRKMCEMGINTNC